MFLGTTLTMVSVWLGEVLRPYYLVLLVSPLLKGRA
jgi:hypothetical protein